MSGQAPDSGEKAPEAVPPPAGGSPPPNHAHHPRFEFRLLDELKHRNIVRVGILYLVVCWLILDPVHVVFHMLEVPAWANRLVVVLMAVGFPAVLLFAWVYEITPGGLKPTVEVEPSRSIRKQTGQRLNRAILAVMAVALTYFVVDKFWLSQHITTERAAPPIGSVALGTALAAMAISDKSVAVLPFLDMSEKKDQEYFSDGLSEELIDMLTKIPDLRVPARTSSFYFKGKSEDIPNIARRLMVAHVLEGSVRKSGNYLRVTAQLVRADNGYHLWSETYDRQLSDVFKVQDDIAGEVVKALKISLGATEVPRAVATSNPEAHALLLQAEYFANRSTPDGYTKAIGYYQQAIRLDPDSAPGWAGLSIMLTASWQNQWLPNGRTFQQQRALALQAAERAVALGPKLGVTHEALAEVRYWFDRDWAGADAEVAKAHAFDPGNPWLAGSLALLRGHLSEALQLWQEATDKDPLNGDAYVFLAEIHYAMGQFTEAVAAARKAVELAPTASRSHTALAQMLLAVGQPDAALAEAEKESDPEYRAYARARTFILVGRRADADAALAEFEKTLAATWAYEIATLHALRAEPDQAFLWLDRAYQQRDTALIATPSINIDPDLISLHGDPRYRAFLQKMKLPE